MGSISRRLRRALHAHGMRTEPVDAPPIHAEARTRQLAQARELGLDGTDLASLELTAGRVAAVEQDDQPITLMWGVGGRREWTPIGGGGDGTWTPYLRAMQVDDIVRRDLRADLREHLQRMRDWRAGICQSGGELVS